MSNNRPSCPALTQGIIASCRFCSLQPGGPSNLYIRMRDAWLKSGSPTDINLDNIEQISYAELHEAIKELEDDGG